MTDVILFHHAQGLTEGVRAFADELQAAGHSVTVPDLYDGKTFDALDEGIAYARRVGFGAIGERGRQAAAALPSGIVYAGFSLGVMCAQGLAQTRPGAKGALFIDSCFPTSAFGSWPQGVPVQIHGMDADLIFAEEGDLVAARDLADTVDGAELFLYPGDSHLFADSSLPGYDEAAATSLKQRVLDFLGRVG